MESLQGIVDVFSILREYLQVTDGNSDKNPTDLRDAAFNAIAEVEPTLPDMVKFVKHLDGIIAPTFKNEPSELFEKSLRATGYMSSSTCCVTCGHCGVTWFNDELRSTGDSEDAEEYDRLVEKSEREPLLFRHVDYSIVVITIDGKDVVEGCSCNYPRRLEVLFWNHRDLFVDYLKRRVKEIVEFTTNDWAYKFVSDLNERLLKNPHYRITEKQLVQLRKLDEQVDELEGLGVL